ncbi:MAG: PD40 domain-containing protein, partial [Fimbriimonadaceae bacterium]|nr:PD40 domain-containing protein [Chitinophagales bacterium]
MYQKIIVIFFFLASTMQLHSQVVTVENAGKKAMNNFNDGIEYVMQADFQNALEAFQKAIEAEPNFVDAYIKAGAASFELQNDSLTLFYLLKAIDLKPDHDVGVYKKLAETEQRLMLYEDAGEHIKLFLEHPKITGVTRRNAEQFLISIEFAINAVKNPVEFNPVNLGREINSEYSEYFPSIAADNSVMVFTRKIPQEGEANMRIGETSLQEDFYITTNNNDVWSASQNVGKPVNTRLNEGAQNISADGRYLFYTLCQSPDGFGRCDLYYAIKFGDVWSNPENCGKNINGGDWESQPSISADGKYLYFCSTRPGGLGGHDIWYAEINENGTWNKAVNAGTPINTPYDEQSPFMHPDGRTIYFSSNGHPNMGGSDLFYAKKGIDDK